MAIRPASRACVRALTLASLAVANSAERLTRVTTLPWAGSAAEAQGVLDPSVAAADDEDVLVDVLGRIVELVLDVRQVGAVAAHEVGIALGADGQDDHVSARDRFAVGEGDREVALAPVIALGLGVEADVGAAPRRRRRSRLPGPPRACRRRSRRSGAQHQLGGRRHHVLAALVAEDGVGEVVGLFEQEMAEPDVGSVRGSAPEARGPRTRRSRSGTSPPHFPHPPPPQPVTWARAAYPSEFPARWRA